MARKFIPNGDNDFNEMAARFTANVSENPQRFGVSEQDATTLRDRVATFAAAMKTALDPLTRSPIAIMQKEKARLAVEAVLRPMVNRIRLNPAIDSVDKLRLGMQERAKPSTPDGPPTGAPLLQFVRAIHETSGVPEHVLEFHNTETAGRPAGVARIEIFVDLVDPAVDTTAHYRFGGPTRPIYVRSFTKSPITLTPPLAEKPMRVVYFARWADASGDVGPMSRPAIGWVEGGSHHLMSVRPRTGQHVTHVSVSDAAVAHEATVMIALLSGQSAKQLNAPPVMRQLEAPAEEAAA